MYDYAEKLLATQKLKQEDLNFKEFTEKVERISGGKIFGNGDFINFMEISLRAGFSNISPTDENVNFCNILVNSMSDKIYEQSNFIQKFIMKFLTVLNKERRYFFMKTNMAKGTIMIVSGIIVTFFPSIISKLFYLIGMAVIIFCVINIIKSLVSGNPVSVISNVIGICVGSAITSLPYFMKTIIPLTVGIILAVNGIDYIGKAISNTGSRILNIILAVVALGLGCMLLFNLVKAGNITRIIAGLVMIATGAYDFFIGRNSDNGNGSGIVDVDSYTVHDDNRFLK